jgi:Protein of unknown function (DUF4256)
MAYTSNNKKALSPEQRKELLGALKARFEKYMNRHQGLEWPKIQAKMEANAEKLWSLDRWKRCQVPFFRFEYIATQLFSGKEEY